MELKWLGSAGFEFSTKDSRFLVDPFLSRNKNARPIQNLTPYDFKQTEQIFISHGHFDHIQDTPQIATVSNCEIHSSVSIGTGQTLLNFPSYNAQAFFSNHIKFDTKLIISTLLKINIKLFKYLPLFRKFPCGQVLSWRFYIEGKTIQFFGSAGSTNKELKQIRTEPIDILLLPLQGHTDICDIGVNYVKHLNPKIVVIHHHDNFYPPISQSVDILPFLKKMAKNHPQTQVIVPQINEALTF